MILQTIVSQAQGKTRSMKTLSTKENLTLVFLREEELRLWTRKRLKKSTVSSFVLDCELVAYDRAKQKILPFQHLYASFEEDSGFLQFATAITSKNASFEEIQKFLDKAVDASCEGLIIKTLYEDATYEPSKRSHNWLKLKKDYLDNIGNSLDLVPIAAFHGCGKRSGVYGAFLLACHNNNEFQSIWRCYLVMHPLSRQLWKD